MPCSTTAAHDSVHDRDPAAGLLFNPFRAGLGRDPYAEYRLLRQTHRVLRLRGCLGTDWILTAYHDIQRALGDPRLIVDNLPVRIRGLARTRDVEASVDTLCRTVGDWLFFLNPPEHTQVRHMLKRHFSRSALAWVRPRVFALVDAQIASLAGGGTMDIIEAVARPLPALVMRELLSLGGLDVDRIVGWSSELFEVFVQPTPLRRYHALERSVIDFRQHLAAALERPRGDAAATPELPLAAEAASGGLDPFQHVSLLTMLFSVGQDTTQHLIGNALLALLERPEQLERIRADRSLLPKALKELARYDTPVQMVIRVAREDFQIGEWRVQGGDRVHLLLGAANRDENVFANPDVIDFDRRESSAILFGAGVHVCLGAHLALLVAGAVLERLLDRFECLEVVPGGARHVRSVHMRGLETLVCNVAA